MYYFIYTHAHGTRYIDPNQNTLGVKSCGQESKKSHAEKDVKSKWVAKASCC